MLTTITVLPAAGPCKKQKNKKKHLFEKRAQFVRGCFQRTSAFRCRHCATAMYRPVYNEVANPLQHAERTFVYLEMVLEEVGQLGLPEGHACFGLVLPQVRPATKKDRRTDHAKKVQKSAVHVKTREVR